MSKPTGLPEVDGPQGLPEVTNQSAAEDPVLNARKCKQCGNEARIVSNRNGVQAYCGPCKVDWPISRTRGAEIPLTAPRGLRKETIVEPDWDKAFDD